MNRIDQRFSALASAGRKGLIPFVTAGDPHPEGMVALLHALVQGGADLIEIGVPFSDPMADGPVIQHASERALARGVGLTQIFGWVAEFRKADAKTPVVLMGYLNPVEIHGYARFAHEAVAAGVDGVLLVVHDYGRDDVSALRPADAPEYRLWSRREGPFLLGGAFRIRVLHCFWTFASIEDACSLLADAFGEPGEVVGSRLKRPRLSWNVGIYHRRRGGATGGVPEPPARRG